MSPTTDDLRDLLARRADDVPPAGAPGSAGPRLAGVRLRVRRARRRRAAVSVAAVAAAVAGVVAVTTLVSDDALRGDRAAEPAGTGRTVAAALDADGLPPWTDPAGRPLQAATSVDAGGPREATVRFTPDAGPDAGVSVLVHCTGTSASRVGWFVGERLAGTVPCTDGRGAAFVTRTPAQWQAFGVQAGRPAVLSLRVLGGAAGRVGDPAREAATGPVPAASALVAVYQRDSEVRGPSLDSGGTSGRRDGVAGLDRPVDLPLRRDVEQQVSDLVAATDLPAGTGPSLRAFRVVPATLDGMLAAVSCRDLAAALGGRLVHVAVDGRAYADLGCRNSDGTAPATWPAGDAGPHWRGYGVQDGPVTLVAWLTARQDARPATDGGLVDERVPPRVDVGVYGTRPPVVDPPDGRARSLAQLSAPPASRDGHPLGTRVDLTADRWTTSVALPGAARLRALDVRIECVGRYDTLVVGLARRPFPTRQTSGQVWLVRCPASPGPGVVWQRLELTGPDRDGLGVDAALAASADDLLAGPADVGPVQDLSTTAVVRLAFYPVP